MLREQNRKQKTENRKQKNTAASGRTLGGTPPGEAWIEYETPLPNEKIRRDAKWWQAMHCLLFSVFCFLFSSHAGAEQARSADAFVDSIGVCTHWGYGDTPYGFAYDKVKQKLAESGIRHIRDGYHAHLAELGKLGIRTAYATDPDVTPEQIRDRVKAANASIFAIDAVEGPNEPDLFWAGMKKSYKGMGSEQGQPGIIKGALQFQRDLYAAMKSDPATKKITVIGPSCGKFYGYDTKSPYGQKGELAGAVDWGNFHPYPGGNAFNAPYPYAGLEKYYHQANFPSINIDEHPMALDIFAGAFAPKPMCATETGYSTNTAGGGLTEAAHGKYMPRLFCEYFRKGIQRAYSYEFVDEFDNPDKTNREAYFGLLRRDTTPKPAYTAVKNLITILQEKGAKPFAPSSFEFKLDVQPAGEFNRTEFVHHLLLQKSDGDFYLVLWHEITAENTGVNPHKQLVAPELPATLTFITPVRRIAYFVPNESDKPLQTFDKLPLVHVKIPDRVVIIQLTPATR